MKKSINAKEKIKRKIVTFILIALSPIALLLIGLIVLILCISGPQRLLPDLDNEGLNEFRKVANHCNISWEEMIAYITVIEERNLSNLDPEELALDFIVITYQKYKEERVDYGKKWVLDYERTLEKKEEIMSFSKKTGGPGNKATSIVDHLKNLNKTSKYNISIYSKEMEDFYEKLNKDQKDWYNALISENLIQKSLGEYTDLPETILVDSTGFLSWPTPDVTTITSPYGWRNNPTASGREFHTGVDISEHNCYGKPVIAATDGTIIQVQHKSTGYGNNILIKHTDDEGKIWTTRYCHLSQTKAHKNQKVIRGDVIGAIGSTGRSTGPHLHFEVKYEGKLVNPLAIIQLK